MPLSCLGDHQEPDDRLSNKLATVIPTFLLIGMAEADKFT